MRKNSKVFDFFICCMFSIFFGCGGTTYYMYNPIMKENSFVLLSGQKLQTNGFKLYLDFIEMDSLYKITEMNVSIEYDSLVLFPTLFTSPYYTNNEKKAVKFKDFPEVAKYTRIGNYSQHTIFFDMNFDTNKKDLFPKQIKVKLHLEGTTPDGIPKMYDISRILKYDKRKQYWTV